jgi:hypothetical protein
VLIGEEFQVAAVDDAIDSEAEVEKRSDDRNRPSDENPENRRAGVTAALKAVQSDKRKGSQMEDPSSCP